MVTSLGLGETGQRDGTPAHLGYFAEAGGRPAGSGGCWICRTRGQPLFVAAGASLMLGRTGEPAGFLTVSENHESIVTPGLDDHHVISSILRHDQKQNSHKIAVS